MSLVAYPDLPRAIRLFPSHALHRLLLRHRAECEDAGLDVDALTARDDASVQRWLDGCAWRLPRALRDDLERIGELADDGGVASLLKVSTELGADPRRFGFDPLEVATGALLDHRALFDDAHARRTLEELRATTEFVGRQATVLGGVAPERMRLLEAQLGQQFDRRLCSDHCRVSVARSVDKLIFTVARGGLIRADEALEAPETRPAPDGTGPVYHAERAVRYRPQRRDVVVYEGRAGRLRVRAGDATTIHAYRRGFGRLLFGDGDWFGTEPIVSLQPLIRMGRAVEAPTPGLRRVQLVGLIVCQPAVGLTAALESNELWPCIDQLGLGGLLGVDLVEATFRVTPIGSEETSRVKIRGPGHVEYRKLSGELIRPYLEERGFLASAGRPVQ